jgi:hypothetical protein
MPLLRWLVAPALAVVLLVGNSACSNLPTELEPFDGRFALLAFDSAGNEAITGTLVLRVSRDAEVRGRWSTRWIEGADTTAYVGGPVGSGDLVGRIEADGIWVALYPGARDVGVELRARLADGWLTGSWCWNTMEGCTPPTPLIARRL